MAVDSESRYASPYPYPGWGPGVVTLPAADFIEGRLPGVCVVTGAPATANVRRRVWMTPGWVAALVLVDWWALDLVIGRLFGFGWAYPFTILTGLMLLFAVRAIRPSAIGTLPACAAVASSVRWRHTLASQLAVAWGVLGLAAPTVAAVDGGSTTGFHLAVGLLCVSALCLVGSLLMLLVAWGVRGVRARLIRDSFGACWLQVRGVHPAFQAALAADIRRRRAA